MSELEHIGDILPRTQVGKLLGISEGREMNEVTSLELSRELYELSGWDDTQYVYEAAYRAGYEGVHRVTFNMPELLQSGSTPAYSLGYLMRKLPYNSVVMHHQESMGWIAENSLYMVYGIVSDTPENATAKLAIELFKQGILTKETN